MEELTGRTLGRYRLDERIGEGGMGVVYKATDEKLRRVLALKVLSASVVKDVDRRRRFLREARLAASLSHPNIATVYDVGESDDGHVYLAMELVPGDSLRHRLQRGALDLGAAVRIAREITRALAMAHKAGVVHRDLKPENVMVSESLEVKVLDFGLAKLADVEEEGAVSLVLTEEGRLVGTPGYMSPEQAAGRPVDARTDVFAVGVVLYEMVSGERPFRGATAIDVIVATSRDEPARLASSVDRGLERIVLRCLEKNADARYADGAELLEALSAIVVSGTSRRPASPEPWPPAAEKGAAPTQASLVGTSLQIMRRGARPRVVVSVAVSAALVAAVALGARSMSKPKTAPPNVSSAAPSGIPITSLPVPVSTNAAMVSEYVAGMQALRDDDWGVAEAHFARVVELEPFLALGHMRLAMAADGTLDESIRRTHYATAVTLRSQLGPRDQAVLEALEPVLQRVREDRGEAAARLIRVAAQYPDDAEIQVWLAMLQSSTLAGIDAADRAIVLDPRDGQAWQSRGDTLALFGRPEEARQSYERCGAISPGSAECFLGLIWLDSSEGRCLDAERDARRAVDRNPRLTGNLVCAMVGAGRSMASVRATLEHSKLAFARDPGGALWTLTDEMRVAALTGDFVLARTLAEKAAAIASADGNAQFRDHLVPAIVLLGIARELGDDAQAVQIGWSFVTRSDAWGKSSQSGAGIDVSLALARQAVHTGALSREEFVARRAVWIGERKRDLAHGGLTWTYAYAATSQTPDEADEALAALGEYGPLSSFTYYAGIPDAEIGNAYLLAGKIDQAVTYLTKAVASCTALRHPFTHTLAALHLGQALEAKGDVPGACASYHKVVDRWGQAKPRSLSAERASLRRKALDCAK